MSNYKLAANEVVLFDGLVRSNIEKGSLYLILTSEKLVFEREKGLLKKERELVDIIMLEDVKIYNEEAQIKAKGTEVTIQTIQKIIVVNFTGMIEAKKFVGKIINVVTGTNLAKRSSNKIKGAIDIVDETLGVDSRGAIKGLVENGIKGTIINGIAKKK